MKMPNFMSSPSNDMRMSGMADLKYIAIIPARFASTRFPGKPLARITERETLVERVWRQVSGVFDNAWVATDDKRIYDAVTGFGGKAVMTGAGHNSGTDRCREAFEKIGNGEDVVVNVQCDEPFVDARLLMSLMRCFDDPATDIATLVSRFEVSGDYARLADPDTPKVVVDENMNALYFSRSVIPYLRGVEPCRWPSSHVFYTHMGIYAYRSEALGEITRLPQSSLEKAESLEQLRWLQNGYKIKVAVADSRLISIDTPRDLENAIKLLSRKEDYDRL